MRSLIVVLGDQLDRESALWDDFPPAEDVVWMAEVRMESTHVWAHKARIAVFLSAMRHFRDWLRERGRTVHYRQLDDPENAGSLGEELRAAIRRLRPARLVVCEPGDHRVAGELAAAAASAGLELEIRRDTHFLCSRDEFRRHATGRRSLRMEFFYREMRKRHGVLMENGQPVGGSWNFDKDNRKSFPQRGPGTLPLPPRFEPDAITREVLELVDRQFPDHRGDLRAFNWPVTPGEASTALDAFLRDRLPNFGRYQDAMWKEEPFLYHSLISCALNLKLLSPRHVIRRTEEEYQARRAPLPAVEGFIRQILGWREYVRGIYWQFMPEYLERNALAADRALPRFYWTGETDMQCLHEAIGQTLRHGYAHHIQRLMITGLYALLAGVHPRRVHEWYLAVYVDAVEWVELPNTLGMSQFADGGVMASKPYVASGKYIQRMSNYCSGCRYDPAERTGPKACPITTLYWNFLITHESALKSNPRMTMQLRNLNRLARSERSAIQTQANDHLARNDQDFTNNDTRKKNGAPR